MASPTPISAVWSMLRARLVRPPVPTGDTVVEHGALRPILGAVAAGGVEALADLGAALDDYLGGMSRVDPDLTSPPEALAFWLNLYNAAALDLAGRAATNGEETVLRIPGAFTSPVIRIAGEDLSLDSIEHGKVRRFGDPRIHAALVCGSISCPTLRPEPFSGDRLDTDLDEQMRTFLASGGLTLTGTTAHLSRVFLWYGGDFVAPHRMPTILPRRRKRVLAALARWTESDLTRVSRVHHQPYDWGLGCSVGPRPA